MAHLDPDEAFQDFRDRVFDGIREHFPVRGKKQTLHLEGLEVVDNARHDDLRAQHEARVSGKSFTVPLYGTLRLTDNETGKVVDRKRVRLADLPKQTQRYSYLLEGREYQIDNQWQLKPGAYTRRRQNGELETRFNVAGGRAFDVTFDPESKRFSFEYNKAHLPLYPLLKTLGVDDDTLERELGKDVVDSNRAARGAAGTLEKFYKTDARRAPSSKEEAAAHFVEAMRSARMRPEATARTLGEPHDHVSGRALLLSAKKLLKVQSGHPEDDRDSLVFKDLRAGGDFAYDKLVGARRAVAAKVARHVNEATDVRDLVKFDFFNEPIKDAFHKNAAARLATQINPVEMVASAMQTTVMGPGGIQSEQQVVDETKFVNPSHLGYLDPVTTPEGPKTGITLRLPIGVRKVGHEVNVPLYNLKTGKTELVPPSTFLASSIVLPDQVTWKGGKPVPIAKTVKMAGHENEMREGAFSEAQYVMRHPSQLFGITTNLIPFMANTSGNRASMASRHMEQAVSLLHREAPLVQVGTGVDAHGMRSFEEVLGAQSSHRSPTAGVVKSVKPGSIVVRADDGKEHEVQTYNNYPLNDAKSVLHATPTVKPGDRVAAGHVLADTNFSRGGTLALGTNLLAAYVPYKGYNFEDGVVISETASRKLSSVHLHKHKLQSEDGLVFDRKVFEAQHPGLYKREQVSHIGEDGLPKVGARIKPGDPLVLATKKFDARGKLGLNIARKALSGAHVDRSLQWDGETEGEVVGVTPTKDGVQVHVRTIEPLQVGDKISGRHGNKGVVAYILPDDQMPRLHDGRHVEVALNPSGVPGRMNVGQVLETVASKIAEKTGKPYVVPSFPHDVDMVEHVKGELKRHGLRDAEELHDPVTGQSLGKALVGKHHVLKLVHQVDKKVAVSSGMAGSSSYDINLQPKSGQRIGSLGVYALLAHGAKANLREMATWKGEGPDLQSDRSKAWPSQHSEVWARIQTGQPLPTPKPTFAFKKFESLLKGAGVNVEKRGHEHVLAPLTDKDVLAMTGDRVLTKPADRLDAKVDKATGELKHRPGGLFDPKLTGGHGGMLWSRIKLAEPVPNPVFEAPICALTGLSKKEFDAIMDGERGVTTLGDLSPIGQGVMTGGHAIEHLLKRVDVPKELEQAKSALSRAKGDVVDKALKKVKYLQALDQLGLKAHEAYVLRHLPVLPPAMRPASLMADGNIKYADINELYSQFAQVNEKLADPTLSRNLTDRLKAGLRANYYDGVKAITGFGIPYKQAKHKGLLHQVAGSSPKEGFFQKTVVQKRQDLTMRSTIIPEPALGLDEVGLPKEYALELYTPFVSQKLQEMGVVKNPLDALDYIKKKNVTVYKALEKAMADRPVLLKRDPALHKYSVQGFQPKVVEGNAIKIHPLVCGGFNADFDGDTMSVFVPIGRDAVAEAHRMKPTNNLFSEASGKVAYQPTLEGALGLYKLSVVGKDSGKSFASRDEVIKAAQAGRVGATDVVRLSGKQTTPGRVLLSTALPESLHAKVLHDLDLRVDKKGLDKILTHLGREHQEGKSSFDKHINLLKDVGNGASFGVVSLPHPTRASVDALNPKQNALVSVGTHSFTLDDFATDKESRSRVLEPAHREAAKARAMDISQAEKDRRVVAIYIEADKKMRALHEKKQDANPTNLFTMYRAGVKPGWDQIKQMVLAPMLLKNSADQIIPTPVTRSYSEGLDVAGYWTQMHGARRGSVMKVQEVQEPGYMSKLLTNSTMHLLVSDHDCGTKRGVRLSVLRPDGKPESDVHDRALAEDHHFGDLHLPAGTVVTPDLTAKILRQDPKAALHVRSPLKCEHTHGICQKCAGLSSSGEPHDIGTNIGVMASQTVGERSVQLTLKSFHTGGAVEQGGGKLLNSFARFQQLTLLPKTIPNAASLAMAEGRVEKIDHTPTGVNVVVDGRPHFVGKDPSGNPLHLPLPGGSWSGVKVGDRVKPGDHLSDPGRTHVNPHDLYRATKSIDRVHDHLATEIYDLYKDEGVKRRHVETVVRAMGGVTKVLHPGDAPGVLRGEFQPLAAVQKLNSELKAQGKLPVEHTPVLKGVDVLPLVAQNDWMGKLQHLNLRTTIADAAAVGGKSHLHGTHPVPGLAYGAEFGLNSSHAHRPGLARLGDVPAHHY